MADVVADGIPSGAHLFRYRARERGTERLRAGEVSGQDAYAVRASLRQAGLEVLELEPVREAGAWPRFLQPLQGLLHGRARNRRRAARGDLLDAIGSLLQAGLPLDQAVGSLVASSARPAAERRMLGRMREALRAGRPLPEAMAAHPDWFDRIDIALVDAGLATGDLAAVLIALSRQHQRGAAIVHKLAMALAYPVVLSIAGLAVVVFISRSTLPQLVAVLHDSGKPTPALTAHLMTVGDVLTGWGLLLLPVVAGLVWLGWRLLGRARPGSLLGRFVHGNPIARARSRARVAQLAATLAHLQRGGLPLAEALDVVAATSGEAPLRDLLTQAAVAVRRGEDLSGVIGASPLVDPEFAQLLRLGEQSGELAAVLERVAERFARAAERSIDRLSALAEPVAVLLLATLIGVVVLAAALPLVELGDLL